MSFQPYIAYQPTKKVRCDCYALVVKNGALSEKYSGGLKAFVERNWARCNEDISVACDMGSGIAEWVHDLIDSGLKPENDFTVIDVWGYCSTIFIGAQKVEDPHDVKMRVDWLDAEYSDDGIYVWYTGD